MKKEILFFKHYSGKTTPEEEAEIKRLLEKSETNRKEMEAVCEICAIENKIAELNNIDTEKGYKRTMEKIQKYELRKRISRILMQACSILTLPLLISVAALAYIDFALSARLDDTAWQSVSAAPGTIARVELPDSSKVWINSGSMLRYPSHFRHNKREVSIDGEAYFEVRSDIEHPFIVKTSSELEVMAHGTCFNVSAYSQDAKVTTTLVEGSVSMFLKGERKCLLRKGEDGIYFPDTGLIKIEQGNVYEKTAWKDGKIVFRDASLEDVFNKLGRKYNIDFTFHDPHGCSDRYSCRITFSDETIEQILGYLEIVTPIRWKVIPPSMKSPDELGRQKIEVWLDK